MAEEAKKVIPAKGIVKPKEDQKKVIDTPSKPKPIMVLPETETFLNGIKTELKNIFDIELKDNNSVILYLINNYYKK